MTHYISGRESSLPIERPSAQSLAEIEEPMERPLWSLHPYRLPIEDVIVPPDEESYWPEKIPHFSLVSSYDCMLKFLGVEKQKYEKYSRRSFEY